MIDMLIYFTSTMVEKKKLLAMALDIAVRVAFKTHIYQFGGRYYHQKKGGPIGLRVTGSAARLVMGEWDSRLIKLLVDNGVMWISQLGTWTMFAWS